jgi:hypothetical protein
MPLHIFLGVMKCSCNLLCKYKSLKFKFDLNSNWFVIYKLDLKKKKNFLIENWLRAEFGVAQPAGAAAQRIHGHAPSSGSKPDPITLDPTQ